MRSSAIMPSSRKGSNNLLISSRDTLQRDAITCRDKPAKEPRSSFWLAAADALRNANVATATVDPAISAAASNLSSTSVSFQSFSQWTALIARSSVQRGLQKYVSDAI